MTALAFAVFDEFGTPADDRVQDYATEAYAEGRKDEREYVLGRMAEVMTACGVGEADRFYMLTRVKDL